MPCGHAPEEKAQLLGQSENLPLPHNDHTRLLFQDEGSRTERIPALHRSPFAPRDRGGRPRADLHARHSLDPSKIRKRHQIDLLSTVYLALNRCRSVPWWTDLDSESTGLPHTGSPEYVCHNNIVNTGYRYRRIGYYVVMDLYRNSSSLTLMGDEDEVS